jgi:branched-chain amino acid aminotransferase
VHRYVLHNREVRDARDALLSPGQVGFLNGWGVFSTLRVSRGVLFAFERHYERLRRDAKLLRVPFSLTADELQVALLSLIEANSAHEAVLRIALVRNRGGLFEGPELTADFDLVAFTAEMNSWGSAARLTYVPNARFGASRFAGTKTTSWAQNLTLYEEAHENGFDEAVLLNESGQVSECTSANIFAVDGRTVYTPPLRSSGCLPGITRAILLEDIYVDGVEIREREMTPSQLEASDLVFITSSTRDLVPVHSIDCFTMRTEHAVLDLLRNAFVEYRKNYVAQALSRRNLVYS